MNNLLFLPFTLLFFALTHHSGQRALSTAIPQSVKKECPNFQSEELKVVWYAPLHEDTLYCSSISPQLFKEQIVFSDLFADDNENLRAFDLATGNQRWKTADFSPADNGISSNGLFIHNGSDLVFPFFSDIHKVDGSTGIHDWHYRFDASMPRGALIGNHFYFCERIMNGDQAIRARLLRSSLETPDWELIYEKDMAHNYEPGFEMPGLWLSPDGDSILIFQNRSWNFQQGIKGGKIDLIAFNLRSKAVEWEVENVTPDGQSAVFPPLLHDQRIFFQGANSLHCLDAASGTEIWYQQVLGESFFFCPNLLYEDLLIANGTTEHLYAFDIGSGELRWQTSGLGPTVPNMDYYKGVVYFGSRGTGKLYGVRLSDGKKVMESFPPNVICSQSAAFEGGVVIDPKTGYLYTHDKFFALCLDLK